MKRTCVSILLLAVLLPWSAPAQAEEGATVESKVKAVTVYADRARVTRTAKVNLSSDTPRTYAIKKLPGWVDDGTVRLALSPAKAGQIVDVRVVRDYLATADDKDYLKAQEGVQEISDQIALMDDELRVLQQELQHIQSMKVFSLEKIPRDAALKEVKVEQYAQVLKFIGGALRENSKARRGIEFKKRKLYPELSARQRKLGELQGLTQLEETSVLVTLVGQRARSATLELTYMLPGATWEPVHELRVHGDKPDSAHVASYAVVSQTSGEDWSKVKMTFSTRSSTESNKIPKLGTLTLGDSTAADRIFQERAASFNRAKQAFEGQNRLWNKMNAPVALGNQMEVYDNNFGQMQMVQTKATAVFQKLNKRGTSAHFQGDGKPTIRADGHPVRIRIGRTNMDASQAIVAAPEQSLNAIQTLRMVNSGNQPLLPGTVGLYHDGAFLGNTDLDFVAEAETFSIFLGVADQLKLSRMLDRKKSNIERGKTTVMKVAWVVTVENLSDHPVEMDLTERIPISENKDIEVDDIEVSGDKEPDSKGLLNWKLKLKPKERKTLKISYRLEYPPALLKKLHRARSQKRKSMPSKAQAYDFDVSEQIMNMEKSF